ncbi:hypothetical protein ACHQM5_014910 [Ranunculus cassubicifolius]
MADNSYMSGRYRPYENRWDTRNNGYETQASGWGKPENHSDHVCKPVIVDAMGRKRPIVSYSPASNHSTCDSGWSKPLTPSYDRAENTKPISSTYWRQTSNSDSFSGSNGYGNTIRDPYFKGYQGNGYQEPTVNTSGGWARPSPSGWGLPPNKEIPLTKPTNDVETAVEYLKEAVNNTPSQVTSTKAWLSTPPPHVPTIDSREARRRYGSISESTPAVQTDMRRR